MPSQLKSKYHHLIIYSFVLFFFINKNNNNNNNKDNNNNLNKKKFAIFTSMMIIIINIGMTITRLLGPQQFPHILLVRHKKRVEVICNYFEIICMLKM